MITTAAVMLLQGKQNKYTCICCRIKFDSPDLQRAHFKTEWHSYNLKRRICSLEPFDLDSFNEIQAVLPSQDKDDDQVSTLSGASSFVKLDYNSSDCDGDDCDWEEIDGDEFLDKDYSASEIEELLARVIKSDTCLFCDKKGSNMKDNMKHMNSVHGFFIPEERYLIDLEGMMGYLGFKVGAGATCLWCNKQFSNLHGVRLHMMYKNHCKISYDQEQAIEEFKEFYDYSTQEQFEMKPVTELVVAKTGFRRRRRFEERSRGLISGGSESSDGGEMIKRDIKRMLACLAKSKKKFSAYRAKILLRTENSNNNTMRSRLRRQNPI